MRPWVICLILELTIFESTFAIYTSVLSWAWSTGKVLYNVANLPSFLLDAAFDQIESFAIHKARIAQAKYFLGDTFARRLARYMQDQDIEASGGMIGAAELVDSWDWAKQQTDSLADKGIELQNQVVGKLAEWGLPESVGNIIKGIYTNDNWLWYTRRLGDVLAFVFFPPGVFGGIVMLTVLYIYKNPQMTYDMISTLFQSVRVVHRGMIPMAASELINPQIPSFILDEFVRQNRGELERKGWPRMALSQMIEGISMPMLLEYYAILIKHFPTFLSGKQSIVSTGLGWIFKKPSDFLLRLADLVGLFQDDDIAEASRSLLESLQKQDGRPAVDDATYIILEYYLANLEVDQMLLGLKTAPEDFDARCKTVIALFMPTVEAARYVIRAGYHILTALIARYTPPYVVDSNMVGSTLVKYAYRHGTPLSLLGALQHGQLPSLNSLLRLGRKANGKREKRATLNAFLSYRSRSARPISDLCHRPTYGHVGTFKYRINMALAPSSTARRLRKPKEIIYEAVVIARMMFGVPLHAALEARAKEHGIVSTVNAILKHQCGLGNPFYSAVPAEWADPKQTKSLRLGTASRAFCLKPSILDFSCEENVIAPAA